MTTLINNDDTTTSQLKRWAIILVCGLMLLVAVFPPMPQAQAGLHSTISRNIAQGHHLTFVMDTTCSGFDSLLSCVELQENY